MAASERQEQAGSEQYHNSHMGAIFKEGFSFSGYERDFLALNLGGGKYLNVSGVSGIDSISDGRGSAFGDFDNDGDLDVFLTTAQREAHHLFRNNIGNQNGFVRITLEGTKAGRDAFGAVVRVKTSAGVQTQVKAGGSGYLSQSDTRLLFGLSSDTRAEWVEVVWPGGETQRFEDIPSGSAIHIVQGNERTETIAERRFRLADPLTADEAMMAGLGIRHGERFPDLTITSLAGETRGLHDLVEPGRRYLVNLWATWCLPCAEEMPHLQRLYPELATAGVELLGISVDLDTVGNVEEYIRARDVTYPIYTTGAATLEALYPRGEATVPLTVLIDGDGRILEIYSGWSEESERALGRLTGVASGRTRGLNPAGL